MGNIIINNNTTNDVDAAIIQNMFDASASIYEASLCHGVDAVALHRMRTMMEWVRELAQDSGIDLDTTSFDRIDSKVCVIGDEDTLTFFVSGEYNDDAEWQDVDSSLDVATCIEFAEENMERIDSRG
jgi:hypothetical protein